jgi:hypothetical protein
MLADVCIDGRHDGKYLLPVTISCRGVTIPQPIIIRNSCSLCTEREKQNQEDDTEDLESQDCPNIVERWFAGAGNEDVGDDDEGGDSLVETVSMACVSKGRSTYGEQCELEQCELEQCEPERGVAASPDSCISRGERQHCKSD